jgi:hypothetical protein
MFTYEQATGRLLGPTGEVLGIGYSGKDWGKNVPATQSVHNVGPIPEGLYFIRQPVLFTVTHGPFVLPLLPDPANQMFGRFGFLIHGDSVISPGTASEGCIILARDVREKIWDSNDRDLKVIAGLLEKP